MPRLQKQGCLHTHGCGLHPKDKMKLRGSNLYACLSTAQQVIKMKQHSTEGYGKEPFVAMEEINMSGEDRNH